jgi:hypothetical protein
MDTLSKAFVIAASSVVIAVGASWLYQQYSEHQRVQKCLDAGEVPNTTYSIRFCNSEANYHGRF